jgi:hypothetical protein
LTASTAIDASDKLRGFGYHRRPLSSPRRSTIRLRTSTANELPAAPKSVELEQRLGRLEICCSQMTGLLEVLMKRTTALQAELDFLNAKMRR